MTATTNENRIRISSFCDAEFHSHCAPKKESSCHCTCHSDAWTFDDTSDVKNIAVRIAYDLFANSANDENNGDIFIHNLLVRTFENLDYSIVGSRFVPEKDNEISLTQIDDLVDVIAKAVKRSCEDGWSPAHLGNIAQEMNVLSDIYGSDA